jgi:hypothetical protein
MEHAEEHPLLLSVPGMGARLIKYYQCKSQKDKGVPVQEINGPAVEELPPGGSSPFLGSLEPGHSQLSIETRMYRAAAFKHATASTDFLLIRRACGRIFVREITSLHTVGVQVCPDHHVTAHSM